MQYPDSVEYLYALGNEMRSAKLGLDAMRALLQEIGNPQRRYSVVHVAGTNGKGSTCAMIASALQASGAHTGLYTSPHLLEPTERIRIGGIDITREAFVQSFDVVHRAAESLLARGLLEAHPSYFETITAMAFWAFAQAGVEWAVVEVGLGGRLDATNVVEPALTVITPVDYDHERWLGNSIESIAAEKAGIIKPGIPLLVSTQRPEALAVIRARAADLGAPFHRSDDWRQEDIEIHPDGVRFTMRRDGGFAGAGTLQVACPLRGAFQAENTRVAAAALDLLGIPPQVIRQGIEHVRWPGRIERVSSRPDVFLDGAHNPAGCAALAGFLRSIKGDRRLWLVFGVMRDKAVSEMTSHLFPLADELILTAPQQPRALRPEALATEAGDGRVTLAESMPQAWQIVRAAAPDDIIVIAGSLFLVAEAAAILSAESRNCPR